MSNPTIVQIIACAAVALLPQTTQAQPLTAPAPTSGATPTDLQPKIEDLGEIKKSTLKEIMSGTNVGDEELRKLGIKPDTNPP